MARTIPARFATQCQQRKPEAIFAGKVMKYLRTLYGSRLWEIALRGGLGMRSGVPDRILSIDGRVVAIEFKNPDGTGRLGPKQRVELEALRTSGAVALVVQGWNDVEEILKQFPPKQMVIKGNRNESL